MNPDARSSDSRLSSSHPGRPDSADDAHSGTTTVVEPTDVPQNTASDPGDEEVDRESYAPQGEAQKSRDQDPFEVRMGPHDPDNPKTWSKVYRWYVTALSAMLLLNA